MPLNHVRVANGLVFLLGVLVLVASLAAHADGEPSSTPVFPPMPVDAIKISAAMDALRPILQTRVRTLSRPITLYSWTNRSTMGLPITGSLETADPRFIQYAKRSAAAFFRYSPQNSDRVGTGLYFAVDPVVTRSYGAKGPSWALLAMETRVQARFLDFTNSNPAANLRLPLEVIRALTEAGCPSVTPESIFSQAQDRFNRASINQMAHAFLPGVNYPPVQFNANGKACQALREAIANDRALGVSAVKYFYQANDYPGCGHRAYAFNVWDIEGLFNLSTSKGFTDGYATGDTDLASREMLSALFSSTVSGPTILAMLAANQFTLPYPELAARASGGAVQDFIRSKLMGCDPRYLEDNTTF